MTNRPLAGPQPPRSPGRRHGRSAQSLLRGSCARPLGHLSGSHRRLHGPGVFEAEIRNIFERTWVYVAHESEISDIGDYQTSIIGRQPIIVSRHEDGQVYVLLNRCRHRGAVVCRDALGHSNYFAALTTTGRTAATAPWSGWRRRTALDRVGRAQRACQGRRDAQPQHCERLVQPLAQAGRGTGVSLVELAGQRGEPVLRRPGRRRRGRPCACAARPGRAAEWWVRSSGARPGWRPCCRGRAIRALRVAAPVFRRASEPLDGRGGAGRLGADSSCRRAVSDGSSCRWVYELPVGEGNAAVARLPWVAVTHRPRTARIRRYLPAAASRASRRG